MDSSTPEMQYPLLVDDASESSTETLKGYYRPRKRETSRIYLTYIFLAIALWSGSIFIATKITQNVTKATCHIDHEATYQDVSITTGSPEKLHCGSTSAEAEALGCVFDPLMASWLPKNCPSYGREEFSQVIQRDNLSYYFEENGKPTDRLINMEAFPHMDGIMYWGTVMEHLTHCAYTLKRIIYTQHTNGRFDTVTGNFSHTDHCVEFLISGLHSDPVNLTKEKYRTDMPVSFLEC